MQGHGRAVDWWAFGVLIYEMLAGYPPFYEEDTAQTYQRILHGRFTFPSDFPVTVRDLVRKLLQVYVAWTGSVFCIRIGTRHGAGRWHMFHACSGHEQHACLRQQVDLSKRYGCLVSGVNDIKSHPWLRSIDWSALRSAKLEPPIRCLEESIILQTDGIRWFCDT